MFTAKFQDIWLSRFKAIKKFITFDIETTGFDYKKCKIFAYCTCDESGNVEVIRLDHKNELKNKSGWCKLKEIFADATIAKIAHNYKFELHFLKAHNIYIHPNTVWIDTMLMSRLLRNMAQSHTLDYLGWEILEYKINTPFGEFDSIELDKYNKALAAKVNDRYDKINKKFFYYYQYADAIRPMLLFQIWRNEFFKNDNLLKDFISEVLVVSTTQKMEDNGFMINRGITKRLIAKLEKDRDEILNNLYLKYGEYFNLKGEKDLIRLLYKKEKLPVIKTSSKTGAPLTNKDILFELLERFPENELMRTIMKYRSCTGGVSMLTGYLKFADDNNIIRSNINTCQAKTFRQSSRKPNMQNISKEEELRNPYAVPARKCFRCKPGNIMVLGDYGGLQMRLIVELAKSKKMMEYMRQGISMHEVACNLLFPGKFRSKKEDKVLYVAGKKAHFTLGFGGGIDRLSADLLMSREDTIEAVSRYANEFPEIVNLKNEVAKEIRRYGYTINSFGNKLYAPKKFAYRGLNYSIQSAEAKIMKRAESNVNAYLSYFFPDIKPSLVIHDELIFDFPYKYEFKLSNILFDLSTLMIDIPEINVPLEVEWNTSKNLWINKKFYNVNVDQTWKDTQQKRIYKVLQYV